jgi:hypothetical protein
MLPAVAGCKGFARRVISASLIQLFACRRAVVLGKLERDYA